MTENTGHDELVQPHDLRADQPGEQDAVHEPEKLGGRYWCP